MHPLNIPSLIIPASTDSDSDLDDESLFHIKFAEHPEGPDSNNQDVEELEGATVTEGLRPKEDK